MSFRDCIEAGVAGQRVSARKAEEAISAYERAKAEAIALGEAAGQAEVLAAKAAMEKISTATAARRWSKMKEMQAAHSLIKAFENSNNPGRTLEEKMAAVENRYATVQSFAMARIDQLLLKYGPRVLRPSRIDGQDLIVDAHFGVGGDAEAKAAAQAVNELMEELRVWANNYGASIPESKTRTLFQTHDAVKVDSVIKETWVNDHLQEGVLDWDVMRFNGKVIDEADRREVLERTYEGIISDGMLRADYLQEGNTPNLASRLARDRFLHYKGAEAWKAMQKKYGAGTYYEQLIGMIDAMSKDLSLMAVFGPSPEALREYAKRLGGQRAAQIGLAKGKNQQAEINKFRRAAQVFDDMYNIHARHIVSTNGNIVAQSFNAARQVIVSAQLGGVLIPSFFGDAATRRSAKLLNGLPQVSSMASYFKEVAEGRVAKEDAIRLGVINEDSISLAMARNRYMGALDGPAWARIASDQVYRIGLASQHMQIARNAEGKQFLGYLHDSKKLKFDDHPLAPAMLEMGITEADWNMMRAWPSTNVRGANFLVPAEMFKVGNASERRVAEKFSDLMQMHLRLAVPDPDLRTRRAVGEAVDPNSAVGQMTRMMLSLLTFPVSIHFNQMRRIAQMPGLRNKLKYGAAYFAFMTVSGAFITQAKALLNGQQLYDMTLFNEDDELNLDFWGRAVINGGSLGIFGDLVMNNFNINNSPFRAENPTYDWFRAAHKLTVDNMIDAVNGEKDLNVDLDALRLIDNSTPNFWQINWLMRRVVDDELLRQADPQAWQAKRRYEQEHEEGMWWGMGEDAQAINPATAVGDY